MQRKRELGLAEIATIYLDSEVAEVNTGFELKWKFAKSPVSILMLPKIGYVKMTVNSRGLGGKVEVPVTVADLAAKMKRDVVANMLKTETTADTFRAQKTMFILPLKLQQEFAGKMYWQMLDEEDKAEEATHMLVAARLNPEGVEKCKKVGVAGNLGAVPRKAICYPSVAMRSGETFDVYILPMDLLKAEVTPIVVENYLQWREAYLAGVTKEREDYARRAAYGAMCEHRS